MIEEIKATTDQAKSYTDWFETEWKRNGVGELVSHNKQLIYNVSALLSIIEKAEKALGRISDLHIRGIEDRAAEPHRAIAKAALQAIRGSE